MDRPVMVELEAFHEDCFAIDSSEKFPEAKIITAPAGMVSKDSTLFYSKIEHPQIGRVLDHIKNFHEVRKLTKIFVNESQALIGVDVDEKNSLMHTCMHAGAVLNEPTVTIGAKDTLSLIFPGQKATKDFYSKMREDFDFKIKSKIPFDPKRFSGFGVFSRLGVHKLKSVSFDMTNAQKNAFDLATSRGYYGSPQKATISDLARLQGIAPSTFAEHLRKAETKLMPVFSQMLKFL